MFQYSERRLNCALVSGQVLNSSQLAAVEVAAKDLRKLYSKKVNTDLI